MQGTLNGFVEFCQSIHDDFDVLSIELLNDLTYRDVVTSMSNVFSKSRLELMLDCSYDMFQILLHVQDQFYNKFLNTIVNIQVISLSNFKMHKFPFHKMEGFLPSINQQLLTCYYNWERLSLMRKFKCNMPMKNKTKAPLTDRVMGKNNKQNDGRWLRTIELLEQDVERLNRINQLYRSQIQQLESDNIAIYAQLQEMRVQQESMFRSHYMQLQRSSQQNSQLTQIISMLEQQIREKDEDRRHVVIINEDLAQRARQVQGLIQINEDLKADIEKYKLKLLQSQRYWLTKTQTYITNKEMQGERILLEKQSDFSLKLKLCQEQLAFKDRIISQKTQEIHKLIQYIQQNLT